MRHILKSAAADSDIRVRPWLLILEGVGFGMIWGVSMLVMDFLGWTDGDRGILHPYVWVFGAAVLGVGFPFVWRWGLKRRHVRNRGGAS